MELKDVIYIYEINCKRPIKLQGEPTNVSCPVCQSEINIVDELKTIESLRLFEAEETDKYYYERIALVEKVKKLEFDLPTYFKELRRICTEKKAALDNADIDNYFEMRCYYCSLPLTIRYRFRYNRPDLPVLTADELTRLPLTDLRLRSIVIQELNFSTWEDFETFLKAEKDERGYSLLRSYLNLVEALTR